MNSYTNNPHDKNHFESHYNSIVQLLAIAISATFPICAGAETTETKEVAINSASATSDWKQLHEERMKLNGNLAVRVSKVLTMSKRSEMVDELRATAMQLPKESRHAHLIRQLGNDVDAIDSGTDKLLTDELKNRLQSLSKQLSFAPKMEAKLPAGFPAPTPVGEIEVKSYPAYRMAKTSTSGGGSSSFFRLFNHIQSNNIAMTAPVEMNYDDGEAGLKETGMAFLYGDPSIGKTKGDGVVQVVDVTKRKAIVLGIRGRPSTQRVADAVRMLQTRAKVIAAGFMTAKEPKVFGYNSPAIPAGNQFYEVLLELQPKSDESD